MNPSGESNSSQQTSNKKLSGWDFYNKTLGAPKYVVAPMVEASELAWRLLCRRHGAQLCYTPMWHSNCFIKDPKYRKDALQSCPEDRPLIVQFCGNDPKILLEASLLAQNHCDAIDINLGCPQTIAKRGHYGAFLQDEWDLLSEIVTTLHTKLSVPVTCKVRIFESLDRTIEYAKMLERSGCQLLTVHGRTRDQKGSNTGIADWSYIKAVRESVSIPVFANGNIQCLQDAHRCIEETDVTGVMSAEGNLTNPAIFEGVNAVTWEVALEYLELVDQYPITTNYFRGHLFKIFHALLQLPDNVDYRESMATCHAVEEFRTTVNHLKQKYLPYHTGEQVWESTEVTYNLKLPPWICQPYVRMPPEEHKRKLEKIAEGVQEPRQYFDNEGNEISRKRAKKLQKLMRRPDFDGVLKDREIRQFERCTQENCMNPKGLKCEFNFCRSCCRNKCYEETFDCPGHKVFIKTKRDKVKDFAEQPFVGGEQNEID